MNSSVRARKPFRIERQALSGKEARQGTPVHGGDRAIRPDGAGEAERHEAVMAALDAMNQKFDRFAAGGQEAPARSGGIDAETYRAQILEAETLRRELQGLSDAIQRTKEEILSLRRAPAGKDKIASAGDALRAVVADTEAATNGIIEAAEAVEELGERINAQVSDSSTRELTEALGEQVTQIFEHCNFQDITGQRITRVVQTMEFIDERVARMMEIWGGDAAFDPSTLPPEEASAPVGEVLDGPSATAEQKISQDDIDKLFD
ncbi:protein phosphatase CheZ [Marivibrio halodurans]|uniref:Protein phosphatase CheZ n=1 Tax=Marivibrio halodurans TaxID=2039722 RepID=A0A8J7V365_9PROT|nr:protein phosphatase CheZ [Marivibrio halodurans]MBP5858060.1 protein phosphatase CheZ [Marivibrio halodurans]